jgi:hypothetical protein
MATSGLLGASGSSTMANSDFVVRERVIADAGCSDAQSRASAWSCVPWQVGGGRHGTQWLISPDLFPKAMRVRSSGSAEEGAMCCQQFIACAVCVISSAIDPGAFASSRTSK